MQAHYIDHMGTDLRVVEAAKISFANEAWFIGEDYVPNKDSRHFKEWCQYLGANPEPYISVEDYGLIHYLAEHNHWTPFAHPQITLRMRAPVPIRTQCFKHKQGFVENEESRRYISSEPTFYIPEVFRGKPTDGAKQGSAGEIDGLSSVVLDEIFNAVYFHAYEEYKEALNIGLCPEQARFLLPQGTEVNWYWTGSLAAFARFAKQRMDSHAQGEIQELAHEVSDIIAPLYPVSWPLLLQETEKDSLTVGERISQGMSKAKERGVQIGATPKLSTKDKAEIQQLVDFGVPKTYLAEKYEVSRQTIYTALAD